VVRKFNDWHPSYWDVNKNGVYILYEINYETYKQDEWQIGHEGQDYLFQFVKINGEFKFNGIQTIP
jgi:hypothetical protein